MVDVTRARRPAPSEVSPAYRNLRRAVVVGAAVIFVGSLFVLPSFESFVPRFRWTLFAICVFATGPAALIVPLLRLRWGSVRFWLAIATATLGGAWSGILAANAVEQYHADQPQWPGIGGALIVAGCGFVTAGVASLMIALLMLPGDDPRRGRGSLPW